VKSKGAPGAREPHFSSKMGLRGHVAPDAESRTLPQVLQPELIVLKSIKLRTLLHQVIPPTRPPPLAGARACAQSGSHQSIPQEWVP